MNFSPRPMSLGMSLLRGYIQNEIHFQDRIFFPCCLLQFTEGFLDCLDSRRRSHEANTECHCCWGGRGVGFSLLCKARGVTIQTVVLTQFLMLVLGLKFKKRVRMRLTCQLEDHCSYLDDLRVKRLRAFLIEGKDSRSRTRDMAGLWNCLTNNSRDWYVISGRHQNCQGCPKEVQFGTTKINLMNVWKKIWAKRDFLVLRCCQTIWPPSKGSLGWAVDTVYQACRDREEAWDHEDKVLALPLPSIPSTTRGC